MSHLVGWPPAGREDGPARIHGVTLGNRRAIGGPACGSRSGAGGATVPGSHSRPAERTADTLHSRAARAISSTRTPTQRPVASRLAVTAISIRPRNWRANFSASRRMEIGFLDLNAENCRNFPAARANLSPSKSKPRHSMARPSTFFAARVPSLPEWPHSAM